MSLAEPAIWSEIRIDNHPGSSSSSNPGRERAEVLWREGRSNLAANVAMDQAHKFLRGDRRP
jgi:hypothetical protein